MLSEDHACARCGRETPVDELVLWTSRERLREYSRRGAKGRAKAAASVAAASEALIGSPIVSQVLQGAGGALPVHPGPPPVETAPITAAAASRQGAKSPGSERGATVQYRWVTVAHVVCAGCHRVIEGDAGRFHDHDRRRAVITALAVVALVALIWVGYTMFMPSWAAAFWQNGARGP